MTYDLGLLFGVGVAYLALLFLIAHATENNKIPTSWIQHPLTYTLSLGVYASSWTFYGSVGFADSHGYQFLTIYLGVTLAFILTPVLLKPILQLTREHQLTSLADLLAFRYRSQAAGIIVTLFMLIGTLPYLALQIRAVTESLTILSQESTPEIIALVFCLTLMLFAILFGARHATAREKHRGLVAAVAFESLIKLIALLIIGGYALFSVFGGTGQLNQWLTDNPDAIASLYQPMQDNSWFTLMFLAFGAAFLLPRQFHMIFTENLEERSLMSASWMFPLFLLLLNIVIPIILWAGNVLHLEMNPDTYVLGITLHSDMTWLPLLAFLGGLSAASAMVIVTSIALATMSMNHLVLPISFPGLHQNLHRWVLWGRRILIACIILAGYGFYALLKHNQGLVQLGLISFVAVVQLLPGIIGVLYWRQVTRTAFLAGLVSGISIWTITLLVPVLHQSGFLATDFAVSQMIEASNMDKWTFSTFTSLTLNMGMMTIVSFLTRQSAEETEAAGSCCTNGTLPLAGIVHAKSPIEFEKQLATILGQDSAQREVRQALADLRMSAYERHPSQLRRLREAIEKNLSGLIGPQLAHAMINSRLELDVQAKTAIVDSIRYVEQRLESSQTQLDDLTNELENLHRYHRDILLDLPLGVCVLSEDEQINIWNLAIEKMSLINRNQVLGKNIAQLPEPWNQFLHGFLRSPDLFQHHLQIKTDKQTRWFNLHKASILEPGGKAGTVILLEDLTNLENLESELAHSNRLASIGRLAAGVAHEIGNPITGIASLAQNLHYEEDPKDIQQTADHILDQTYRINNIIQSLMNFSRSSAPQQYEKVNMLDVLNDASNLAQLAHKSRHIDIDIQCPAELQVKGNRQLLSQVFVNLLNNAIDASADQTKVKLSAFNNHYHVTIQVEDQGSGIPEEIQKNLFEPFVTSKPTGKGTGLGLSLAHKFISDHNGHIEIESELNKGTRVVVTLPIS